ncbi:LysE family translocator [Actinopolymorpha alba]|uniref:LysE family translocator n=1 Tax=Actinopolymorpha alba TaxID=533267 RepID=UPI00192B9F66|nr:LysE family translocator [Actinopolymorpha alba]
MPDSGEWLVFLGTAALFAPVRGRPFSTYSRALSMAGAGTECSPRSVMAWTTVHVVAAALGLSALLAAAPAAFTVVKCAGSAYLVFLGVQAIRRHSSGGPPFSPGFGPRSARSPLMQGLTIELLNPKTALYFMALLPHFVHPERAPAPLVFTVLGLVAAAMALIADLVVVVFASQIRGRLSRSFRWQERQRAVSGFLMIGLGCFAAVA